MTHDPPPFFIEIRYGVLNAAIVPRFKVFRHLGYLTITLPLTLHASTSFVQSIVQACSSSLVSLTCISSCSEHGSSNSLTVLHGAPSLHGTKTSHVQHLHLQYPNITIGSIIPLLQQCPLLSSLYVKSMQHPDIKKIRHHCPCLVDLRWTSLDTCSFLYNRVQPLMMENNIKDNVFLHGLAINGSAAHLFTAEHQLRYLNLHMSTSNNSENDDLIAMQHLFTHNACMLEKVALSMNAFQMMKFMPYMHRLSHLDHVRLCIRPFGAMRRVLNNMPGIPPDLQSGTEHTLMRLLESIKKLTVPIVALSLQGVFKVIDPSRRMGVIAFTVGMIAHLREIEIREHHPSPDILASLFHHAQELSTVSLVGGGLQVTYKMFSMLSTLPHLQYLHLQGIGKISGIGLREMADQHEKSDLHCQVVMLKPDDPTDIYGKCFEYAKWKMGRSRFEYKERPTYEY